MLRRNVRLRKEYLFKKSIEDKENAIRERKARIKTALEGGDIVAPEDRNEEFALRGKLDLEDERGLVSNVSALDNEYAYAGVRDPRILLTTSRDPSARLQQFVKELNLIFPNSQRLNRGAYVVADLTRLCQANDITDMIVVHEHRGAPDGLVVSHMPLGPTVYFGLEDVVLRHDLPQKPSCMSTVNPHLVFDNLDSKLGERIRDVLKFLFPPAAPLGQRVMCFANRNDRVHFRHFVWSDDRSDAAKQASYKEITERKNTTVAEDEGTACSKAEGMDSSISQNGDPVGGDRADAALARAAAAKRKKDLALNASIKLEEVGPRFILKPYRIELGTLDMKDLEVEWSLKPYFNKPKSALSSQ